jgi:hypothetical protein
MVSVSLIEGATRTIGRPCSGAADPPLTTETLFQWFTAGLVLPAGADRVGSVQVPLEADTLPKPVLVSSPGVPPDAA